MSAFKFLTIVGLPPISEDTKTFIENTIMNTIAMLSPMTDLAHAISAKLEMKYNGTWAVFISKEDSSDFASSLHHIDGAKCCVTYEGDLYKILQLEMSAPKFLTNIAIVRPLSENMKTFIEKTIICSRAEERLESCPRNKIDLAKSISRKLETKYNGTWVVFISKENSGFESSFEGTRCFVTFEGDMYQIIQRHL
jgi:hypothetical protein